MSDRWATFARDARLSLAGLLLVGATLEVLAPRLSVLWLVWPSTHTSAWLRAALAIAGAVVLVLPRRAARPRALLASLVLAGCLHDTWWAWREGGYGISHGSYGRFWIALSPLTLPSSFALAAVAAPCLWVAGRTEPSRRRPARSSVGRRIASALGRSAAVALLGFSLVAQMVLFHASIEEPAARGDVIVVLGARANRDGTPSLALADRVATAATLEVQLGHPALLMSGGVVGDVSEPRVMRAHAAALGVPEDRVMLDESGANTAASLRELARVAKERGWERIVVVSHGHHLARVRLACRRVGLDCAARPARQSAGLALEPWFVVRDAAALALYAIAYF